MNNHLWRWNPTGEKTEDGRIVVQVVDSFVVEQVGNSLFSKLNPEHQNAAFALEVKPPNGYKMMALKVLPDDFDYGTGFYFVGHPNIVPSLNAMHDPVYRQMFQ